MKKLIGAVALAAGAFFGIGCVECTLVGCYNGVAITVAGLSTVASPATLQACVNDQCQDFTFEEKDGKTTCKSSVALSHCELRDSGELFVFFYTADVELAVTISLEAKDADGKVVFSDSKAVDAEENRPNGPRCEPTCHNAQVQFAAGS